MAKQATLEAAERVIEACKKRAEEIGTPMSVAVADAGANLVAFARMDGTLLAATVVAQNKAVTAVEFQMATRDMTPMVQPGAALFGIQAVGGGRAVAFGGGIPLTDEGGRVVGGVGVSGGSPEEDHDVAAAGAAAFRPRPAAWALPGSLATSPCSATPTRAAAATGSRSWWAAVTPTSATCSATA